MKLKHLAVLLAVAFLGVTVFESVPTDAKGWHYDRKKPPRKRKLPKKKKPLYVQLDPLRVVKLFDEDSKSRVGPNVIIAMDTSIRMQYDFEGWYYDEQYWDAEDSYKAPAPNPRTVATSLGVPANARFYHRRYKNLIRTAGSSGLNTTRYEAEAIEVVHDKSPDYLTFYDPSRLGMARDGVLQAVMENLYVANFGLVRMRHGKRPEIPDKPGNDFPVFLSGTQSGLTGDLNNGSWKVTWVHDTKRNLDVTTDDNTLLTKVIEQSGASAETAFWLMQPVDSDKRDRTLVPAGFDTGLNFKDSPLKNLLVDTHTAVTRAMGVDKDKYRTCRNTAVVLVVGGGDGGGADPLSVASTFKAVTVKGVTKPVPIYVIAVGPSDADVPVLKDIARVSGGEYFQVYGADQVAFAANYAVQSVFRRPKEFDLDLESEFQVASPIVGSVDLTDAKDINGAALPNTTVFSGGALSQGANVLITTGFSLPGFEARVRAFRTYAPVADPSKPYGYKFSGDGTPLWVAHAPADVNQRNIFTHIPGAGPVALTEANVDRLLPYLRVDSRDTAVEVLDFVRQQPIGAVLTSTPALMSPPSLSPAPDPGYSSFAQARRDRRSTVFFGANDGMLHAVDGRLGVEVWAFVPFNMLPKLKTLLDGQPIGDFDYFVDASPRIADIKVDDEWRTYLFVGQSGGGTFYSAWDVSDVNLGLEPSSDAEAEVIAQFRQPGVIPVAWTFPSMSSFDYTLETDDSPFGDISASASAIEKSVGQTWSTPAVGQVGNPGGPWVVITGSGYLPPNVQIQTHRGNLLAGTTFYVLEAATGQVLSSRDVGDDRNKESLKNSLTADVTAASNASDRYISRAYIGDAEGILWRFDLSRSGSAVTLAAPKKMYDGKDWSPIFTSAALAPDGTGGHYLFFGTGIDILPWTRLKKILQFTMVGLRDQGSVPAQRVFEMKLDKADSKGGDERPSSNPTIAGGVAFFTTTTEYPDTPCVTCESSLFAVTPSGGAAYDLNGDGRVDTNDKELRAANGRATAVYVADKHVYFGTDKGVHVMGEQHGFNNAIVRAMFRTLTWRDMR